MTFSAGNAEDRTYSGRGEQGGKGDLATETRRRGRGTVGMRKRGKKFADGKKNFGVRKRIKPAQFHE